MVMGSGWVLVAPLLFASVAGAGTLTVCPTDPFKTAPGDCGCGIVESMVESDRDCDGDYDADDARLAMADFGIEAEPACEGDLDGSATVNIDDLLILLSAFGNVGP